MVAKRPIASAPIAAGVGVATTAGTATKEPIQIVRIYQPLCTNTFGVSPCTATGTADTKCYNTRATCQDTANFELGDPLDLYFSRGHVAERNLAPYIIPSLRSVSTSPTKINLSGANPDAQGLGNRAYCTLQFQDHPHTDRVVDPYQSGRSWDAMDPDRGSFWSRWKIRNKYRQNIRLRVYEGYAGQTLDQMVRRDYFIEKMTGPDASGQVTINAKDVLARVEERKAQAPVASPGLLYGNINSESTSFVVANAVEADYSATGTLRIDDELMTYTSRALTGSNVTFSGITRGTDGTTAEAHDFDATVQQCLRYTKQSVDTIAADLLENYANIEAAWLDATNWATEISTYRPFYNLTNIISIPTSVAELISELQEQAQIYIWWDERDSLVKMKSIKGEEGDLDTLTDSEHIIAGTLSFEELPRERVSQAWIYYDVRNWIEGKEDVKAYQSQYVLADLESETDELYGTPSIRKIWGRWIPSDILAGSTASSIVLRYVETPTEIQFELDAKDRSYWVGDTLKISHYLDVDQHGERRVRTWTILSADEYLPGERVRYRAADTSLFGTIYHWMPDGSADYPGAGLEPEFHAYWGDDDGLLSDGNTAATWG